MRILVTGGAGFIGYHLTRKLLDLGHNVTVVDNLSEYYDAQLKKDRIQQFDGSSSYTFHKLDILEYDKLEKVIKDGKFEVIVHLAAIAGVRYSLDHGLEYVRNNYEGTYNIFELSKLYGSIKVVYASSSSVYGDTKKHPTPEDVSTDEPLALYGATKKADEILAHAYSHLFKIPAIGLRFFTVYGPWGRPDMALFLFTKGILEEYPIDIYNKGKMKRDFTYVDDIVDGIIASIRYETDYELFNLGSGKEVELMNFIELIEKKVGMTARKNFMEHQVGDVKSSLSDISKAEKLLGYKPKTFIEQGVSNFIDWYREYYKV